ncbi:cell division cycle-associated protein 2 isoform X4 [Ascaphus truei]|uniref:cell division cycle-associated protein 2 isoform X4 n=1 Tax=Ascaphus truei TaxID=8439 RepID=UPI003F5A25D9
MDEASQVVHFFPSNHLTHARGVMASGRVLQEISISPSQPGHDSSDKLMEQEVNIFPPLSEQPTLHSSRRYEGVGCDKYKENLEPADCPDSGNITKEKCGHKKNGKEIAEAERSARSNFCYPVAGQCDLSQTDPSRSTARSHTDTDSSQTASDKILQSETSPADGNYSTTNKDELLGETCNTPMDFPTVTITDLGISTDSFTPKYAGKSPKSLLKHRRRSSVGVRGSPETNFLIRYIAQQRSKTKREPDSLANPFTSPRNFLLKDKICAFRDAFQTVEETEGKVRFSEFSEESSSQARSANVGEERCEPAGKRKKVCSVLVPLNASAPDSRYCPLLPPPAEETAKEVARTSLSMNIPESECSVTSGILPHLSIITAEGQSSPSCRDEALFRLPPPNCSGRKVMFAEPQRPELFDRSLPPCEVLQKRNPPLSIPCFSPFLRPALKKTQRREIIHKGFTFSEIGEHELPLSFKGAESSDCENIQIPVKMPETGENVKDSGRRKRVTFGKVLSPELFDEKLPPNTPLRRGGTPYNRSTSGSSTPAAMQTLTHSPLQPLQQPNFDYADAETLQPHSLCFESPSSNSPISISLPETSLPESGTSSAGRRVTRSSIKRKFCILKESSVCNISQAGDASTKQVKTGARNKFQKNKKPGSVVSRKAQLRAARGKGKKSGGRSQKYLQKPLYGKRETASKTPLLSPIPELPEFCPMPSTSSGWNFFHGRCSRPRDVSKEVMKVTRTKGSESRTQGKVHDNSDHSTFKESDNELVRTLGRQENDTLQVCWEGIAQTPENKQGCLRVVHSNSTTRSSDHSEVTAPVLDSGHLIGCLGSEGPHPTAGTQRTKKKQPDRLNPLASSTVTIATSLAKKESNGTAASCSSQRMSVTCKCVSQRVLEEETTPQLLSAVSPESVAQGLHAVHNAQFSWGSTCAPQPVSGELQSPARDCKEPPVENLTSSSSLNDTISSLMTETVTARTSGRSSRNLRRTTIFYLHPEGSVVETSPQDGRSTVSPHFVDDAAFSIEETLQSAPSRKVRRSMRLHRDSEVIGLSWVQEEKGTEERGRRQSISFSTLKQVESPNQGLENGMCSPAQKKEKGQPVPVRKSRRRTLCNSMLQEASAVRDIKRRTSSCSYKDFNICHSEAETNHTIEKA